MKKMMTTLLWALALCGCSMPYVHPFLEQPGQNDEPSPAPRFSGVLTLAQHGPVRVVWIHGMCTHTSSNATLTHQSFAAALGAIESWGSVPPGDGPQRIWFKDLVSTAGGIREIETRYLLWSPLTTPAKESLLYDAPKPLGEFPFVRATLNNQFKVTLMNDCFSDAVIYTGSAGDTIRQWVRSEVCDAFGGSFTPPISVRDRRGESQSSPSGTSFRESGKQNIVRRALGNYPVYAGARAPRTLPSSSRFYSAPLYGGKPDPNSRYCVATRKTKTAWHHNRANGGNPAIGCPHRGIYRSERPT